MSCPSCWSWPCFQCFLAKTLHRSMSCRRTLGIFHPLPWIVYLRSTLCFVLCYCTHLHQPRSSGRIKKYKQQREHYHEALVWSFAWSANITRCNDGKSRKVSGAEPSWTHVTVLVDSLIHGRAKLDTYLIHWKGARLHAQIGPMIHREHSYSKPELRHIGRVTTDWRLMYFIPLYRPDHTVSAS